MHCRHCKGTGKYKQPNNQQLFDELVDMEMDKGYAVNCAMAEDILFMIDVNHNYNALCMGNVPELSGEIGRVALRAHGEIIIQNDVWIGHGVVIMDGVTVHNGAVTVSYTHLTLPTT